MNKTAFLSKEICFWHDPGPCGPYDQPGGFIQPVTAVENPETKRRIKNLLEVSGLYDKLYLPKSEIASREQLLRFHTEKYIDWLINESKKGYGNAGEGTPFRQDAFEIACHSAGLAITAIEEVLHNRVKNAYALCRPPGHHAEKDIGKGFCLLGNIPIAIEHAIDNGLAKKFAVVDWDVHHGNGTESAFYDRSDVLTISLHHGHNYPINTGEFDKRGVGEGLGFNLNIPLPPGCGSGAYRYAFEKLVLPEINKFNPDIIIVASGFDSSALDPLGPMLLTSLDYAWMTEQLMLLAEDICAGKIMMTHEGGYSESYVPFCAHAVIETMSGIKTNVVDPVSEEFMHWDGQKIYPHQKELIDNIYTYIQ